MNWQPSFLLSTSQRGKPVRFERSAGAEPAVELLRRDAGLAVVGVSGPLAVFGVEYVRGFLDLIEEGGPSVGWRWG